VCDRVLEEEGVKGMVGIYEYGLHLLPYGDVLSMEDEDSFKNIFVVRHTRLVGTHARTAFIVFPPHLTRKQENDTSSLYFIVRSLMQLQRTYGTITNIKGKAVPRPTRALVCLAVPRF